MIDIAGHPLTIGIRLGDTPDWALPVLTDGRRDAAFVDTGFLLALLNPNDPMHDLALLYWHDSSLSAYTTPLVVAETVRRFAKYKHMSQPWRVERVSGVLELVVPPGRIIICAPPRELIFEAARELQEMQHVIERLDFCDCLSLLVLDKLVHRRVLGFDSDFRQAGATMEPGI
jgi:predicted nucleic acid-binding protein